MRTVVLVLSGFFVAASCAGQNPLRRLDEPLSNYVPDAVGDFDGDGDLDVLAGATILLNDGTGGFTPTASPTLVGGPGSLTADLNGDGIDDVVSRISGPPKILVSLSQGGGVFAAAPGLPVLGATSIVWSADAGDVDGDGDVDLLLATTAPYHVHGYVGPGPAALWLNNGSGGFTAAPTSQLPATIAPLGRTFLRDFDLDGDLDAVFAGMQPVPATSSFVILRNQGGGVFALEPSPAGTPSGFLQSEMGDFNGDGAADLGAISATTFAPVVFLRSAAGFLPGVPSTGYGGNWSALQQPIVAVDVDGDGADEWVQGGLHDVVGGVVVAPPSQALPAGTVVPNAGAYAAPSFSGRPAAHDLDLDGDADLLFFVGGETIRLMNDAGGGFVVLSGRAAGVQVYDPVFGDFDGDGFEDVLGVDSQALTLRTGLGDGNGFFKVGPTTSYAANASSMSYVTFVAVDLNGDGRDDLYGARNMNASFGSAGSDQILIAAGGGTFLPPTAAPSTEPVVERVSVDWDGDGDLDLLLGRRTATTISNGLAPPMLYVENLGAAGLAAPAAVGGSHATYSLCVADFDGDADPDVLQVNASYFAPPFGFAEQSVVYLNNAGTFVAVPQPGLTGYFAAAGDLDGDGDADAVVDGQVWFSTAGVLSPGPALASALVNRAELADLDGDGALDLVETPCTVMMNAGGGVFGAPESVYPRNPTAATAWSLPRSKTVDFDRDGDLDVITPGPRIVVNVRRQLAHRGVVRAGFPATIDAYGTPGAPWALFASPNAVTYPVPPIGTVLIDPLTAQFVVGGAYPAAPAADAGRIALNFVVPAAPGLIGQSLHWQAIDFGSARLTNRLTSTILSY